MPSKIYNIEMYPEVIKDNDKLKQIEIYYDKAKRNKKLKEYYILEEKYISVLKYLWVYNDTEIILGKFLDKKFLNISFSEKEIRKINQIKDKTYKINKFSILQKFAKLGLREKATIHLVFKNFQIIVIITGLLIIIVDCGNHKSLICKIIKYNNLYFNENQK